MVDRLASGARGLRLRAQHETAIAVAALDEILLTHFEIDLRMTERAATIAGHTRAIHCHYFRLIDRHETSTGLFFPFRLLLFREVFTGGLIHDLHRQPDLAAIIHADQLYFHDVAFFHHIGDLGDALGGQFGNVHESVARPEEIHEGAEVHDLHDLAFIDFADFRLCNDRLDPFQRRLDRFGIRTCDLHRAVVLNVDLRAGLFDDFTDHLAARSNHFADFV